MRALRLVLVLPLVMACAATPLSSSSPAATLRASPDPTPHATRAPTPRPTPATTPATTPTGAAFFDFPPATGVALEPGRYSSQPPFDIEFSFEIPNEGWGTAHHNGEFFDVMQPVQIGVPPQRWVAFARPAVIHGSEDIDAEGLTPADIVAAFDSRADIELGEPTPYQIDGIDGLVIDIATDGTDVKPFGGPDGDLQLDPAYEGRTVIVSVDDAPLLVMVFAPRGELEEAWTESQPIIDSIRW